MFLALYPTFRHCLLLFLLACTPACYLAEAMDMTNELKEIGKEKANNYKEPKKKKEPSSFLRSWWPWSNGRKEEQAQSPNNEKKTGIYSMNDYEQPQTFNVRVPSESFVETLFKTVAVMVVAAIIFELILFLARTFQHRIERAKHKKRKKFYEKEIIESPEEG